MRIADYKIKFFDFVAGNLRRLAELLTVEAAPEQEDSAPEKTLSPMEDWLEKTRNLSAENWVDFSGANQPDAFRENEPEPQAQPPNSSFAAETGAADFVPEKPKKQTPVETFFNKKHEAAENRQTFDNPEASNKAASKTEIFRAEKPKKTKPDSRFFSIRFSDRKRKQENAEALEPLAESFVQSTAKDEDPPEKAKRNFRLFPAESASESSAETAAPDIINFVENQPPPKSEVPTFERKKSAAVKFEKIESAKPKSTIEKTEPIVKKPSARGEISDQFPPAAFSRKTGGESAADINFEFPKRKTDSANVFPTKAETAAETPNFSSPWKKSRIDVQEYFNPERDKKTDNQTDNPKKFAAAASPWIDLPDETAFEAADDIQINLSENEHLRFLEGEQAGKI